MTNKTQKITIHDVAKEARVSIATVSRVLNNKGTVKASTCTKVMEAVKKIGYDNFTLKHDTNLILILLPDIVNPFYSQVIEGIASSASRYDYQEIIVQTGTHPLTQSFIENIVNDTHSEGVITLDPIDSLEALNNINEKLPIVQCAEHLEDNAYSYVSIDDVAASKIVIDYMVSKGMKRIALINGPLKYKYARKRREGFINALEASNLEVIPNFVVQLPAFSYDAAFSVATQILSMDNRPDAIFAASDVFAVAAIKAAKRLGIKIPEDLGIIGFDNTNLSLMCEPPLTTVKQPQFQMGFLACEMLLERIQDPNITPKQIMLDVELIVRESL